MEQIAYQTKRFSFEADAKSPFEQIADLPHSYILADGIEHPIGKKLPLWFVGLVVGMG